MFSNEHSFQSKNNAKNSYLSDGLKLSATDADANGLYYLGSLVYEKQNATLGLESAGFSAGRFAATSGGAEPRYFLTDHLGSVRMILNDEAQVIEQNAYYPFGKRWDTPQAQLSDNRYRYNGKEEQAFVDLPYVDYGARMYNPEWGRWLTQDPLAEDYFHIGQYAFCAGNPIRYIDNDGRKIRENSKHLQPHMKLILNNTATGRMQYNKMVNNVSEISVKRVEGYYVDENGVTNTDRLGNTSLTAVLKDPLTGEIIGGKSDITLFMRAIKDDAERRGMRVDDREAATLAEEIEHTEAENIKLQLEEQEREEKEKEKTGKKVEIPYENKESEQKAHVYRDQVLKELGVEP